MLDQYSWSLSWNSNGSPKRIETQINSETVGMHCLVLSSTSNVIDHANGNIFDNRFSNLRVATYSQNQANRGKSPRKTTSQYKGVSWYARDNNWQAGIKVNKVSINLGRYKTEKQAARAYNEAAIKYFGEFAKLNEFGDPLGSEEEKKDVG
jgi:hypothetical protein